MALKSLIKKVLPEFPAVHGNTEVAVLQEIPVETVFFALKESDPETSLWFFENAKTEQVQGLIDLDCWSGAEFKSDRFQNYFQMITQLTPKKLHDYSKNLDPEVLVRMLMEYCDVFDFDPQEPPHVEESKLIITPDNLYALVLKTEDDDLREAIMQWLNKLYSMDMDLARRHLESCKWEQLSDLEEFAYRIKKGRIEEMGFVDREEAIELFSQGNAPLLKQEMLAHPLKKEFKKNLGLYEGPVNEELLPQPVSQELFQENFFTRSLAEVEEKKMRETLGLETIRSVNAFLMAEELMHSGLDLIQDGVVKTRHYLDLGLMYLADGKIENGAELLKVQPIFKILRLGWLLTQDLVKAANEIRLNSSPGLHWETDQKLIEALQGRHPQLEVELLNALEVKSDQFLSLESITKTATRLGEIAQIDQFFQTNLKATLNIEVDPFDDQENAYTRLMTGLYRQACQKEFMCRPLSESEWNEITPKFSKEKLEQVVSLMLKRAPALAENLLKQRFDSLIEELDTHLVANNNDFPDPRYFNILRLEENMA